MTDKETLFKYRIEQAEETLSDADKMLKNHLSPMSILNRAYYSFGLKPNIGMINPGVC